MPLPPRVYDRTLNSEIERLLYQVKVIRMEAEGLVWGLNDERFNWTPEAGRWSMAQCFDHLNITNRLMITQLEDAMQRGRAAGKLSDGPYTYGFVGRWFLRMMQPPVKRRFKAPKPFQPALRKKLEEVLPEWGRTHDRVAELIREANGLDLERIKVVSPATKLLKYNLGIAFWVQTTHDRRHLWQAREVRNQQRFPQA